MRKRKKKRKEKVDFTKIVKTGGFFAMRQSQATIQISTSLQRLLFYPERQETLFLDVSLITDKRGKNFNFLIQNMGRQEVTGGYKRLQGVTRAYSRLQIYFFLTKTTPKTDSSSILNKSPICDKNGGLTSLENSEF